MTTLRWEQDTQDTGRICADTGRAIAVYSYSAERNHPHFRDLRPLNHEGILTSHAPWDHRWHHGLWWSWKFINDVLYWEDHESYGGARKGLGRAQVTAHSVEDGQYGPVIREALQWRENASGTISLREQRSMSLAVEPAVAGGWRIDWDHEWTATGEAHLSVTPYPENSWGGYAGLNFRPARSMGVQERIRASGGRQGSAQLHGREATWASYSGLTDGAYEHTRDRPAFGGLALLVHPENAPTPLYCYSAEQSFGFLAAAPLMLEEKVLEREETLRLRFRTVVLGEEASTEQIDELYRSYAGSSAAQPFATRG